MTKPEILTTPPPSPAEDRVLQALQARIRDRIAVAGGWLGFDAFMAEALYAPGLGYYCNGSIKLGQMPQGIKTGAAPAQGAGSDFVTAPELSPLFGKALARQVAQALEQTGADEVWEFGAGTGALALQIIDALKSEGVQLRRYVIVDLSGDLKARQQSLLTEHADVVTWIDQLPDVIRAVVVGNEVLDAMPVELLARKEGRWFERGVVWSEDALGWEDRPTEKRPPLEIDGEHDYLTEIHPQGEAFVRTLGHKLKAGAIFLLDYGYPESEYYHPQRHMGTVMCHRAHRADPDPLDAVGLKDITAHVNFTGIAVVAQDAGLDVLGYTCQAHFLMNCGMVQDMQAADLPTRVAAQKLLMEHEMGELFKVIGFTAGPWWQAMGFAQGDRTHRL
jgi:SAM-dependent MidA family methyltransferase